MKVTQLKKNYPIVEDIVGLLYEDVQQLVDKYVENTNEKSIFLMYINLYLMIHMSLDEKYCLQDNIKEIMTDFIKDSNKRKICLERIEQYLAEFFKEEKNKLLL